jgi:hypothetical protein
MARETTPGRHAVSRPKGSRNRNVIPCPSEAAYKRHIRRREVPCEEDFAAVNDAINRRREARKEAGDG